MALKTRIVTFDAYVPHGELKTSHFVVREADVPALKDGEFMLKAVAFSLDPVNRMPISGKSPPSPKPMPPYPLGTPLRGAAVARVVESRNKDYPAGMLVSGWLPWSELTVWPIANDWMGLTPVDEKLGKPSLTLTILGVSGLTAYFGIVTVGEVRSGQTVLISSAAGSVGALVGQIAKIHGARVIGMTTRPEKLAVLTDKLGFDAAIDYRAADLAEQLAAAMPNGPDIYFDNVGGKVSNTVMWQMRRPSRIVECGQISTYNDEGGGWRVDVNPIHANGLRFEGFNPAIFMDQWPKALAQLTEWVKQGKLKPLETVRRGFEQLPGALVDLFGGQNIGKMMVEIPEG